MLHTDDIFDRDAINLELDRLASQFAKQRQDLIALGLSSDEQDILTSQMKAIKPALSLQREAAEMALSDNGAVLEEARQILINKVYPKQGIIIDHFMQLLALQESALNAASEASKQHYESSKYLE